MEIFRDIRLNKMRKIFLTENQIQNLQLLREGSRDNLLLPYLNIINGNGNNVKLSQLKGYLLNKFVIQANIHNLSLASNFYLVGVARYYFNGDLTENKELNIFNENITDVFIPQVCETLDNIILYLRNSYIDSVGTKFEQPEDFGEMSLAQLFKKYGRLATPKTSKKNKKIEVPDTLGGKINDQWNYEIIYSQEECKKYKQYTSPGAWCITYAKQHYNYYCKQFQGHFIIFFRKNYENVPREMGENSPFDNYGLSLIAVMQSDENGEYINGTTRWNHGYQGKPVIDNEGFIIDYQMFKNVVGISDNEFKNLFEEWKYTVKENQNSNKGKNKLKNQKNTEVLRKFKYAQMLLKNGIDPKTIFDNIELVAGGSEGRYNFRRSVVALYFKDDENNTAFCTLCDRGNIIFETLNECKRLSNCPYGTFEGYTSSCLIGCQKYQSFRIYDYKRHKLLEIEGEKDFKALYKCRDKRFVQLQIHDGRAIYNIENGSFITYGEHYIFDDIDIINEGVIYFILDYAARSTLWYDIDRGDFIEQLNGFEKANAFDAVTSDKSIIPVLSNLRMSKLLFDKDSRKFIADLNECDINVLSKNYILMERSLYNLKERKYLNIEHGNGYINLQSKMYSNVYLLFIRNIGERFSAFLIFNADTGEFLQNNENGIYFNYSPKYDEERNAWYTFNNEKEIVTLPQNFSEVVDFTQSELNEEQYITNTINSIINEENKEDDKNVSNIDNVLLNEDDVEIDNIVQTFEPKDTLNPKIWEDKKHLNKRVRLKLMDIANDFIETLEIKWVKPKDVILTGSLANYNWSNYSDFDLHILMDFEKVDKRTDFVKEYFNSKKTIWNDLHGEIKIYGFPVEVYVQDINESHTASGIYSLFKDKWIKEPSTDKFKSIQDDVETIKNKTKKYIGLIEKLEELVYNNKDSHIDEVLGSKIKNLFNKIKRIRKESLKNGDEMSIGNLMFKALRRMGYIEKLIDLRNLVYNKINTIK